MIFLLGLALMDPLVDSAKLRIYEEEMACFLGYLFQAKGELQILQQQRKGAKGPVPKLDKKISIAQLQVMEVEQDMKEAEERFRRQNQPPAARPPK